MRVFALTGSIASGKSTVARHWSEQGLAVVSADELARKAVLPGTPGLAAVVTAFGSSVLTKDGTLDRAALAADVFGQPERLATLNSILHPEVRRLAAERFERLAERGDRLACYEIPLLYESGLEASFSPVVVVSASPETQLARLVSERGMSTDAGRQRLAAQLPSSTQAARADYVISNDGALEQALAQADRVLDSILEQQGMSRADLAHDAASAGEPGA